MNVQLISEKKVPWKTYNIFVPTFWER